MNPDASQPSLFLQRWGGFLAVSFALSLGFATSSLPSPLYPIYQDQWHLQPSELTYIYAIYMVAVLFALLCFGRLADTIGRYAVICIALGMLTVGLVLSGVAPGVHTLFTARGIIGFANGLLTTAGALALVDAHPAKNRRVASIATSAAIAMGVGLGPLISGLLAQTGFAPLRLPYFVVSVLALGNLTLTWYCRNTLRQQAGVRMRLSISPKLALPGPLTRAPFLLASLAAFTMFASGGLFATLVPSFLYKVLPWQGPAVPGVAFLLMAVASTLTQFSQRNIDATKGLVLGLLTLVLFLLALGVGIATGSPWGFFASIIFIGIGQGLCFMASTMIAAKNSDEDKRSANMASYFVIAYIGGTIPVIIIGQLADHWGMTFAVLTFCALAGAGSAAIAYLVRKHMR